MRQMRGKRSTSVLSSSTVRLVELLRSKHATHLASRTIRKYVQSSCEGNARGVERERVFVKFAKLAKIFIPVVLREAQQKLIRLLLVLASVRIFPP